VVEFNEISPLKPADLLNVNVRDHRKILVIDGRVAYTGGINFSSTYSTSSEWISSGDQQTSGWRDTHVAVRGPAAAGFQSLFLKTWHAMGGKEDPQLSTPENLEQQGNEVVAILSAEGGDNVQSEIFHAYLRAIESARERIWITQAYFAPDKDFMDLLRQAAHRGVDVRVMVPGVSDSEMLLNASRSRYGDLLKAGVEIFERQNALLHAKTAVIDGVWSTVGSSNLDSRSFLHNDEVNAIILGRHFAKEMEAQFLKDELESLRVSYGEWRERSLWKKLKEKLSWIVEYWI
jgi:cardiolipin synthase